MKVQLCLATQTASADTRVWLVLLWRWHPWWPPKPICERLAFGKHVAVCSQHFFCPFCTCFFVFLVYLLNLLSYRFKKEKSHIETKVGVELCITFYIACTESVIYMPLPAVSCHTRTPCLKTPVHISICAPCVRPERLSQVGLLLGSPETALPRLSSAGCSPVRDDLNLQFCV